jgi:hypothetical protein
MKQFLFFLSRRNLKEELLKKINKKKNYHNHDEMRMSLIKIK